MPSDSAIGNIGETLVTLELAKRGWMVFLPHFEEKVDLVAVREENGRFRHLDFQVKTARQSRRHSYSFTIRRKKFVVAPDFYYVWCCLDDLTRGQAAFYTVPSSEVPRIMGKELQSATWREKGLYTFHLPVHKWDLFKDKFPE